MLTTLAKLLRKKLRGDAAPAVPEESAIYESLAMTEELREALFPTTPRMVSAIFERPLPPLTRPRDTPSGPDSNSFLIV